MITKVTITGADNSVSPLDLYNISKKYPFVEWGILCSKNAMGSNRFPSSVWLGMLASLKKQHPELIKLSCHLCGQWVKQVLMNSFEGISILPLHIFDRMQINTHGVEHNYVYEAFEHMAKEMPLEVILQGDNVNQVLVEKAAKAKVKHSVLFDLSHGAGISPENWPKLIPDTKCGYAGGISPENIEEQMLIINKLVGKTEVWIDMETHVRSKNDREFDLEKVEKCLEIASKIINAKK